MSYPASVSNRTLIIGGGVHGAIYAATYETLTGERPIICEARAACGGIFGSVVPFRLNSTHNASYESVTGGPTRIPSRETQDNLNWLPNSAYQVTSDSEYPSTTDMARAVRQTCKNYADVYTDARINITSGGQDAYECDEDGDTGRYLGTPKRIIWATGLTMNGNVSKYDETSPAIVTAETFLGDVASYRGRYSGRVAVVGGGDTACTVVEYLTGQGETGIFGERPTDIDWYGGYSLPLTKKAWAHDYHARYIGLARHMPQKDREGVIHPFAVQVSIDDLGASARVRGRNYGLVIDCRGFKPWSTNVATSSLVYSESGDEAIARSDYNERFFKVGPAAGLSGGNTYFPSKFPAANQAIYVTGPRTAMLAARHARQDVSNADRG